MSAITAALTAENTRYQTVRDLFVGHCLRTGVAVPTIRPARASDPCDYSDARQVRINVRSAGDTPPELHAAHVFGHYLADYHEAGNVLGDARCDQAADVIAGLLLARDALRSLLTRTLRSGDEVVAWDGGATAVIDRLRVVLDEVRVVVRGWAEESKR